MLKKLYQGRWGIFFILPNLILFTIFMLIPLIISFGMSFTDASLTSASFIGLDNYQKLFSNSVFNRAFVNTIYFVLGVVPFTLIIGLLIAVVVFQYRSTIQTIFKVAFYIPVILSGVVLSMVWKWMFHPVLGVLNHLLTQIGIDPILWIADPNLALPSLMFVVITFTVGDALILMIAGLGSIPSELWDAAIVDGASTFEKFRYVTLPLLRPSILFVLVTQTIAVFQIFVVVFVLTKGGPAYATQTIVYHIYQTAFTKLDLGLASAEGVILVLLISSVAAIQFKLMGDNVEY